MATTTLFAPGRLRVKICGVTNPADAALATAAGADAIGVNLFPGSKRFTPIFEAGWLRYVPVIRVAVVVNPSAEIVSRIGRARLFDAIQFHGDESPEFCAASPLPWIRAIRLAGPESIEAARTYATPYILLDAHSPAGYGGTGQALDSALAATFIRAYPDHTILLAGGLRPDTVAAAVRVARPQGVDVASGVESAEDPRRKDPVKVRAFVAAARAAAT